MGLIIEESGMKFGEYQDCQVFHIERSEQYINGLRQNGIKTCEFILQRGNCFLLRQSPHAQERA